MYLDLIHVVAQQKLTQRCKAIIAQFKINKERPDRNPWFPPPCEDKMRILGPKEGSHRIMVTSCS